MRNALIALLCLAGLAAVGCATSNGPTDTPVSKSEGHPDWSRNHFDPVCGVGVNPHSPWQESYGGQVYYFDSEECLRRFRDKPQAYVPGYGEEDGHRRIHEAR